MNNYAIGQRWISEMEPELGLGIVRQSDERTVVIEFPASKCERKYAVSSASLIRVEFKENDIVTSREGHTITITSVSVEDGFITYHGENDQLPEDELSDTISFTTPQDRLQSGFFEKNRDFNLRYRTLVNQHKALKSKVRGFTGGRIELIPHQLYVAHEITSRHIPRVLLSDETGLGKTIEACLVLHRLLLNGRIDRVLILLPNSLVHQWFIELLRRFNLVFRIFDEEYCESVEVPDHNSNPFLEDQLAICSIDFLASQEKWRRKAVDAGWDVLVIDEAHHLTEKSPEYILAEELSLASRGLMLLTATPEQLGHRSHFGRLHLLDPARYFDFKLFEEEEKHYRKISGIVNALLESGKLNKGELKILAGLSPDNFSGTEKKLTSSLENDETFRRRIVEDLLDRHGTGRAVFRNTRAAMTGFPKRAAHLIPLEGSEEDLKCHTAEIISDPERSQKKSLHNYKNDPRIIWLAQFLKKRKNIKVLLICHSTDKVKAIEDALRARVKINIALFHAELSLLQRDRNAAWFAKKGGAQILICSEIGSEGRNFQFSHHLVLFDLPFEPELVEQRIGRLDRIGQKKTINIYIPYLKNSESELLARWYHEGLNAFEKNVPGVYEIYTLMNSRIRKLVFDKQFSQADTIIKQTQKKCKEIAQKMKSGRDRLLELHSFRKEISEKLIQEIKFSDEGKVLEKFMIDIFHYYGIREDLVSEHTYRLNMEFLSSPEFPLPIVGDDDLTITFDRENAINHEDIEFLSWDHPMVIGAMDLLLGSEKGNCTVAVWHDSDTHEILLEAVYVLECVAPKNLYVDRFMPPTPIRIVVNHLLKDCTEIYPEDMFARRLKNTSEMSILENPQVKQELVPEMLKKCKECAEAVVPVLINGGSQLMDAALTKEVSRLMELKKVNKNIRDEEISMYKQEVGLLSEAIHSARLRLDALRFISRGQIEV